MALRLFNTLSGKLEEFRTIEPKRVRMYSCGPTVYDYGHIGNFRTFVAVDILRRFLRRTGYRLDQVMNITDVDDKIIRNAARDHLGVREYAYKFEEAFFEDCRTLNLETPERIVRATEHIDEMADFIAKLEKPEAIENLDEILRVADGVMVARGDLGVEMSPEKVPVIQKLIIAKACEARLPVITATQMLESMTQNPRPTRAEASDVANAVFDGSDALMLSAETAAGAYPIEAVEMMDRIIREAESSDSRMLRPQPAQFNIAETAAELICHASEELQMKVIAVFTETGSTGRLISKHRPRRPIIAFSTIQETRRRLSLYWGVVPRTIAQVHNIEELVLVTERRLLEEKLVKRGDVVGIVAGTPLFVGGTTNFMKFHIIGNKDEKTRRAKR